MADRKSATAMKKEAYASFFCTFLVFESVICFLRLIGGNLHRIDDDILNRHAVSSVSTAAMASTTSMPSTT